MQIGAALGPLLLQAQIGIVQAVKAFLIRDYNTLQHFRSIGVAGAAARPSFLRTAAPSSTG